MCAVCRCMCQSLDTWACLCEHAFFCPPPAWTITCGEVPRSSQSWEQCEGRRVPQKEIAHARAPAKGEESTISSRTRWNAWHATAGFLQLKNGQCSPSSGAECWAPRTKASSADWTRASGIQSVWFVLGRWRDKRPEAKICTLPVHRQTVCPSSHWQVILNTFHLCSNGWCSSKAALRCGSNTLSGFSLICMFFHLSTMLYLVCLRRRRQWSAQVVPFGISTGLSVLFRRLASCLAQSVLSAREGSSCRTSTGATEWWDHQHHPKSLRSGPAAALQLCPLQSRG